MNKYYGVRKDEKRLRAKNFLSKAACYVVNIHLHGRLWEVGACHREEDAAELWDVTNFYLRAFRKNPGILHLNFPDRLEANLLKFSEGSYREFQGRIFDMRNKLLDEKTRGQDALRVKVKRSLRTRELEDLRQSLTELEKRVTLLESHERKSS